MKLYISERQKKMPVNCDSKMEAKKKATKKIGNMDDKITWLELRFKNFSSFHQNSLKTQKYLVQVL